MKTLRKILSTMLLLMALAATAAAQTVSRVEYYWDTDPGRGHGTPITGWSAANQVNINTTISTAGLSAGIHTLGIRSRSSYGVWSSVGLHRVVVGPQVSRIEYFYDSDPGFGQGRAYATTVTDGTVTISDAQLSATGISDGYHRLGLRARAGSNGMWSPTYWQDVLVNGAGVVQVEYFYDSVPAYGEGIQYTAFTPGTTVTVNNAQLSATSISDGYHRLGLRAKAGGLNGQWSPVYWQDVLVNGAGVVQVEYFYDSVPAYGEGIQYTAFTSGTTVTVNNAQLSAAGISDGYHRLGIRAKAGGLNGQWSPVYWQNVLVNGAGITQVEYYWDDAHPAHGQATPLTGFTPGSMVNVNAAQLSAAGLATGVHRLALRARTGNGLWSPTYFHEVFVSQGADYAEYYWDSDPGYGQATPIAFTPSEVAMVNLSDITVPTSDGLHTLCIRARAGKMWSPTYTKTYCNAPTPMFSLIGSDTVCQGEQIIILDETEGTSAQTLYSWDMQSDGSADNTTQGDITYTYTQAGTYELTLGVGNDNTCQNTYSHTIVVRSTQSPTISINRDKNNVCEGTEVRFVATTQRATDYNARIEWYRNDTLMADLITDTIYLSDLRNNDRIRAKVRIDNPCAPADSALSSQLTMSIYALPTVTMQHRRYVFTDEQAFTLASRFAGMPAGGTYSINGITTGLFNPSRNIEGMYEIGYTYTNNHGCSQTVVDSFELRERVEYMLTAQSADSMQGSVTGSGLYTVGDTAIIEATAVASWRFDHWNDGNTDNPRRIEVMSDTILTAFWQRMCRDTVIIEHAVACDNYTWHGTTYTASTNTPVHSEPSALGCDSTHRLDLIINTSSAEIETVTVCDSYTWHGTMYTASIATPTFTTTNAAGCDSVTTLHLTVNYSNSAVETITACDSYTWLGTVYTASTTTPTFTTTNAAGCDSVTNLHLTVNYSNSAVETVTACNSFLWHGIEYTASTSTPTYTTENAAGCDSVTTLHLTVNACSTTEITACDSYTWRGTTYTASGRYTAGNDTLELTVNHSNSAIETVTACDSYIWHGASYTSSTTTPTFTTTNSAGCDSVTTLHLTVNYSSSAIESTTACDSYTWHGTSYAVSTSTPTFTTTNAAGCDSVTTLHLTVNYSNSAVETITACDSYTWHGTVYTASTTTPTFTTTNAAGCDSVTNLHLTVNYSNSAVETITACDSYTWHGTVYAASATTPTFTTTNAAGCDSVTTLHLTVNYSNSAVETATACDSYTWHGTVYTASTTMPTFTTTNAAGCDSVTTLYLTVNYSNSAVETVTACNSFLWHGTEYMASTSTATYTTENAAGCDSVTTLHLTVNACSTTEITACDSYTWRGTTYTASGRYTAGNDTLELTVNHSNSAIETVTACDSYIWHGASYTSSTTTPTFTTTNSAGCDSVTTLHLTVNYSNSAVETVTACNNFLWHGTEYTASTSTATYTTENAAGCDSVVTLHLTINHCTTTNVTACDGYTWHDTFYNVSGTYVDGNDSLILTVYYSNSITEMVTACDSYEWHGTIYVVSTDNPTFTTTNADGCDSVVTLHLTIKHSSSVVETVTACDSFTWHGTTYVTGGNGIATYSTSNAVGCDSTVTLNLSINHSTTGDTSVTACDNFTWGGTTYTSSGVYSLGTSLTNAAGCDSTAILHLTVVPSTHDTVRATICDNESYLFEDSTYTTSGIWTFQSTSQQGCDSLRTLMLTVQPTAATSETVAACDSWQGFTTDTTLVYILATVNGCDSIHTINVSINHSTDTTVFDSTIGEYEWHGVVYTESGTYTWTGTTAVGCDSTVTLILTINSAGIPFVESDNSGIRVYPNPTSGQLSVDADDEVLRVEVYDLTGRKVKLFDRTTVVDLDGLPSGSYTLRIHLRHGTALRRVILR